MAGPSTSTRAAGKKGNARARKKAEWRCPPAPARLLVIIDATVASKRALRYVCQLAARRDDIEIHLAHLEPRLPPALLESGGSELPEQEEAIEAKLHEEQRRWIGAADRRSERILRVARTALERAGIPASRIRTCASSPLDAASAAEAVLALAREERCQTIVVGHRAHAWFSGLGGAHLAEQLVRHAKSGAVWVID